MTVVREVVGSISTGIPAVLTEAFRVFPQSLQGSTGIELIQVTLPLFKIISST